ncbi:MAG: hypothetical protein J7514_11240, partial [Acinetobacter oleivorans]|nr:hypothetical protein [Acinetobacter oleivorans]
HNIVSEVEMIDMQNINEAFERMLKSDVKYRFVIDLKHCLKINLVVTSAVHTMSSVHSSKV